MSRECKFLGVNLPEKIKTSVSELCISKSDARRTIQQGGVSANDQKITDFKHLFDMADFKDGVVLKKGKKNFKKLILK